MRTIFFSLLLITTINAYSQLMPQYDSIPMRDGKKLAMTLYQPSGCTQCPTILVQTPYNRLLYNLGLPLGIGQNINAYHYNIVILDWRGFYGSFQAAYAGSPTRGEDGYDAVQWIATQTWSDGKIGTWGPSALGRVQYMTAKENPPNLVCMVPQVAGPQYSYAEYYPGGVLRTEYVEQLDGLGFGTSPLILANPFYNILWQFSEAANYYPDSIRVPTFMIGGWYDHNTEVMLQFFNGIRNSSQLSVRDQHRLLMGPWVHGGHGTAYVGSATQGQLSYPEGAGWSDSLAWNFFDYHLRNISNGWNSTSYIRYFQMGDDAWQQSAVWPPAGVSDYSFYMHTDGSLNTVVPANGTGSLSYNYDPLNPSPTIGGCTLRADLDQGPYDQVPDVESRNDVLIFSTDVLQHDVLMKGQAEVHLKISSDKKDTDFAIRLTDVYPDGRSMLLVDGIARMRFRNGFTTADTASMIPGTIYPITIELPSTCITFKAGHRIRVDVSSSNYPKYNRNDNSGGVMYPGPSTDSLQNPQTAHNTVYMNSANNSYIVLPVESFLDGVEEQTAHQPLLNIYPNPATGETRISFQSDLTATGTIILMDLTGKVVLQKNVQVQQGENTIPVLITGLASGMYTISLWMDKNVWNGRVVVE